MIAYIKESKEDIQSFIDKFGEETYNEVRALASSPTAKKMKLNDLTFCVSRYSKEWMKILLADCEKEVYSPKFNKRFGGALAYRFDELIRRIKSREINDFVIDNETGEILDEPGERLDYKYWLKKPKRELINFIKEWGYTEEEKTEIENGAEEITENNGWITYKITNYLASEYYGMGSGWCICGAYPGHYDRGQNYFYDYSHDGYYFIINAEADERYCVFFDEDECSLSIWDGSHGTDTKVYKDNIEHLDSAVQESLENIKEETGHSFEIEVPDDPAQQKEMIEEELEGSDWVEWIKSDLFFGVCDYKNVLEDLAEQQEEWFRVDLTPKEQFEELECYTNIIEDEIGLGGFEDLPDDVAGSLWEYSEEYAEAWKNEFDGTEGYVEEYYGDWDRLSYEQRADIVDIFDIYSTDVADYIVYELREGYEWCEDIARNG